MRLAYKIIFSALLSLLLAQAALPALAADPVKLQIPIGGVTEIAPCSGGGDQLRCDGIAKYVVVVYEFLIRTAALLAVLMLVIGGVQWLVAAGEQKRLQHAQKYIRDAIVGLVLILCSHALLWAINPKLVDLAGLDLTIIKAKKLTIPTVEAKGACCYRLNGQTKFSSPAKDKSECSATIVRALANASPSGSSADHPLAAHFCGYPQNFDPEKFLNDNNYTITHASQGRLAEEAAKIICWEDDTDDSNLAWSRHCTDRSDLMRLSAGGLPGSAAQVKEYIQQNKIKFSAGGPNASRYYTHGSWARGLGILPTDMGLDDNATTRNPLSSGEATVDPRIVGAILLVADKCGSVTISALNEYFSTGAHPAERSADVGHSGGKAVDLAGTLCGALPNTCNQAQRDLIRDLIGAGYEVGAPGGTKDSPACGATFHEDSNHLHIELGARQAASAESSFMTASADAGPANPDDSSIEEDPPQIPCDETALIPFPFSLLVDPAYSAVCIIKKQSVAETLSETDYSEQSLQSLGLPAANKIRKITHPRVQKNYSIVAPAIEKATKKLQEAGHTIDPGVIGMWAWHESEFNNYMHNCGDVRDIGPNDVCKQWDDYRFQVGLGVHTEQRVFLKEAFEKMYGSSSGAKVKEVGEGVLSASGDNGHTQIRSLASFDAVSIDSILAKVDSSDPNERAKYRQYIITLMKDPEIGAYLIGKHFIHDLGLNGSLANTMNKWTKYKKDGSVNVNIDYRPQTVANYVAGYYNLRRPPQQAVIPQNVR